MRVRMLGIVAALAAAAVPVAVAQAADTDKATGGGQVVFDTQMSGPGDTIGFSAIALRTNDDAAKGQVQIIDRTGAIMGNGGGAADGKFHGIVKCLVVDGQRAFISGVNRDDPADVFELFVQDNGEGQTGGNDTIVFRSGEVDEPGNPAPGQQAGDEPCGVDNQASDDARLARGNAQVHNGG